jgi:DoxX-like family
MSRKRLIVLWVIQGALAALFLFAGGFKLVASAEQMKGPVDLPLWFLRFIGSCEVLGALGLILPGLLHVRVGLTPLAACGLVIIMIGATVVNVIGMGVLAGLPTLVIGGLAAFVAVGRRRPTAHG